MLYVRNSATEEWVWKNTEVIQNYGNRANTLDLIPYLSQGTLDIFGKATQVGIQFISDPVFKTVLPAAGDRLSIKGALRVEVDQFDSKKNDMTQQLLDRMAMIELAVNGRLIDLPPDVVLGRNGTSGNVEVVPQSKFATPAMIDQAIIDLVGGAPGALDTLIELAAALNNDASFSATIANSLALKAPTANPSFTGPITTAGQVVFPAVQNPSANSNTLDDYEEGIWVPVLTYTVPGTSNITFSRNSGRYQKIGNRVSASFDIRISVFSKGTASGYLIVSGLPFAPRAGGGFDSNLGTLAVGNSSFTGIPSVQTATGLSSGNVLFLFKTVSNAINVPLDDPVGGTIYFGQIDYESN
jgi:hypothetical protein